MATIIRTYEIDLPEYSASYLVNADSSGIEDSDIEVIDSYMNDFYKQASILNAYVTIEIEDSEPEFVHKPAFGLACNCFKAKIHFFD